MKLISTLIRSFVRGFGSALGRNVARMFTRR